MKCALAKPLVQSRAVVYLSKSAANCVPRKMLKASNRLQIGLDCHNDFAESLIRVVDFLMIIL